LIIYSRIFRLIYSDVSKVRVFKLSFTAPLHLSRFASGPCRKHILTTAAAQHHSTTASLSTDTIMAPENRNIRRAGQAPADEAFYRASLQHIKTANVIRSVVTTSPTWSMMKLCSLLLNGLPVATPMSLNSPTVKRMMFAET
jgi:hypothetical protein